LKATINKVKLTAPVTVRNSVERVKQLADAKSTSQRFLATGGHHLTGDDFIKSAEFNDRKAKIDLLEATKKRLKERAAVVQKGEAVLEKIRSENIDVLSKANKDEYVKAVLTWYNIPASAELRLIADRRKKCKEVIATAPPLEEHWTNEDEEKLKHLKMDEIDMSETALGRYEARKKKELRIAAEKMSVSERENLIQHMLKLNEETAAEQVADEHGEDTAPDPPLVAAAAPTAAPDPLLVAAAAPTAAPDPLLVAAAAPTTKSTWPQSDLDGLLAAALADEETGIAEVSAPGPPAASTADWLHRRASVAVRNMEAECSALDVCLMVLRQVTKIRGKKEGDNSSVHADNLMFTDALKSVGKRSDDAFIEELAVRASDMAKDDSFSEETLRKLHEGSVGR